MREYREQGDLDTMLKYAEERMGSYPRNAEMMQQELIRGYQQYNRLGELINHFQEVLKSDPTDLNAYKVLGQAYHRNRELAKAVEIYEKAATLSSTDSWVQRNLAKVYQQQGAHKKATAAYRKALSLLGSQRTYERNDIASEMIHSYLHLGDIEAVVSVYLENIGAIESSPAGTSYHSTGEVYTGAEDFRRDILNSRHGVRNLSGLASAFETKVSQLPDDIHIWQILADIYVHAEKMEKVIAAYERLTKLVPKDRILFAWLASAYNRAENASASAAMLKTLKQLTLPSASHNYEHYMRLSRIYRWGKLYDQAIDVHKEAIKLIQPTDSWRMNGARRGLVELYREAGKPDLAAQVQATIPQSERRSPNASSVKIECAKCSGETSCLAMSCPHCGALTTQTLITALMDSSPGVRASAAFGLARHKDNAATDALIEVVKADPEDTVRIAAIGALPQHDTVQAAHALGDLLKEDDTIRQHAWRALERMRKTADVATRILERDGLDASARSAWEPTGPLNIGRAGHTATLLPDGHVLVAGGGVGWSWTDDWESIMTTNTCELYDPTTGTWTMTGSLQGPPRSGHQAVLLRSGKVLIAGGPIAGFGNANSRQIG